MQRSDSQPIAAAFWARAGGRERFGQPVRIAKAVSWGLQVAVVRVAQLDTSSVTNFLFRVRPDPWLIGAPRPLRGCLLADGGHALIFVESTDSEDEQRFTIAHETAHLLRHYLAPRTAALAHFGPSIMPVLNRTRPATYSERISAAMNGVPIEPFRHAMDRNRTALADAVRRIEDEADDLAVELLAPWSQLKRLRGATPADIRQQFGLPAPVAARVATLIAPSDISRGVLGLFRIK